MMKILLFILLFSGYCFASAQTKRPSSSSDKKDNISYFSPSEKEGSSLAVVVGEVPLAHTRQFSVPNKNGELVGKNDLTRQIKQIFNNIDVALKPAGANIDNIVKLNVCLSNPELMPDARKQISFYFKNNNKPAVSYVVSALEHDALIGIDAVATSNLKASQQGLVYLKSKDLPGAANEADVAILPEGATVYVSGQAAKGEIGKATRETLKQLEATLQDLKLNKEHIVQIKSFINPASDLPMVKREIAAFFKGWTVPPTVYVEWTSKDPLVEIELIAASPGAGENHKEQLEFITPTGMAPSPVYSKVTRINYGKKIYFSGLYGRATGDAVIEVTDIFTSLTDLLKTTGSDLNHLAKATYYVANGETSNQLNLLRPKYYDPKRPPAASKAMVKGVGKKGNNLTIDMIGVVPSVYISDPLKRSTL